MDVITDVLQNVATSYPIGTGVAVLGAVWYALVVLRERAGDASVGGCVTDEGIQKARERQQAALAQAATARAQAASSSCCVPAAPTPKPASTAGEPAGEMPERMRALSPLVVGMLENPPENMNFSKQLIFLAFRA